MSIRVLKYPFDPTAASPDNFCTEERELERQYNRVIAPFGGDFYSNTMVVYGIDEETGDETLLAHGKDYFTLYINEEAEERTGKPVHVLIYVADRTWIKVKLEYQIPGGLYSSSNHALIQLMKELSLDNRPVSWNNIFGKPTEFNPTPHLHHSSDIYGMEFVVLALEELTRAIVEGDNASHDILYDYIERIRQQLLTLEEKVDGNDNWVKEEITRLDTRIDQVILDLSDLDRRFKLHLDDKGNPHGVTKDQVGLANVENYPIATSQQAIDGVHHRSYMTPLRTREALSYYNEQFILPVIQKHITDDKNPHKVTKEQVGLGNVDNYPTATKAIAEKGESNAHFMTPLRTKEAIDIFAGEMLRRHIDDHDNPHKVTKSQVGLSDVPNWYPAPTVGVANNNSDAQFVSPLFVQKFWDEKGKVYVDNHTGRTDNPHKVTKSQIGLSNVLNYGVATVAEAIAGVRTDVYTTPRDIKAYHNSMMTVSGSPAPSSAAGYPAGHVWYQYM